MKTKILLIASIFSMLFLSSCEKDHDDDDSIIGRWNVTEFNASGTWETVKAGEMYAQFNRDGTYHSKFDSDSYSGTWSEDDDVVTCTVSGEYVIYRILNITGKSGTFEVREPGFKPYSVKAIKE